MPLGPLVQLVLQGTRAPRGQQVTWVLLASLAQQGLLALRVLLELRGLLGLQGPQGQQGRRV